MRTYDANPIRLGPKRPGVVTRPASLYHASWSPLALNPLILLDGNSVPKNLVPNSVAYDPSYHRLEGGSASAINVGTALSGVGSIWRVTIDALYGAVVFSTPYLVGASYRFRVKARLISGFPHLYFGPYFGYGITWLLQNVTLTSEWQIIDFTYTVPAGGGGTDIYLGQIRDADQQAVIEICDPQLSLSSGSAPYNPTYGNLEQQVWRDRSGHGNHAQLGSTTGNDANDPAWIAGGLHFDGIDDSLTLPAYYSTGVRGRTWWLKVRPSPDTSYGTMLSIGASGTRLTIAGNYWRASVGATDMPDGSVGEIEYPDSNAPHFMVLRYRADDGMFTFDVDGIRRTKVVPNFPITDTTSYLGRSAHFTGEFAGFEVETFGYVERSISDGEVNLIASY